MKKIYYAPDVEIVELGTDICLLAGSLGSGDLPNADFNDVIPGSGIPADAPSMLQDMLGLPGVTF